MAITTQELEEYLEESGLKYDVHESGDLIVLFGTERYTAANNRNLILIVVSLSENGEFIKFFAPSAYDASDAANPLALYQSLLMIQWKIKMVDFELDVNDGEIRPTIDFPLEDGTISFIAFERCIRTLPRVLDDFDEIIRHAISFGEVHENLYSEDLSYLLRSNKTEEDSEVNDISEGDAEHENSNALPAQPETELRTESEGDQNRLTEPKPADENVSETITDKSSNKKDPAPDDEWF